MRLRTLLLLLLCSIVAAFTVLNWHAFLTPTQLSLGFTKVEGPLGVVMLGLLALLSTGFLFYSLSIQASALLAARRHARELEAIRSQTPQIEERFNELRELLTSQEQATQAAMVSRLDRLENELRSAVEASGNTLAAYLDQIEEHLEQQTTTPPH